MMNDTFAEWEKFQPKDWYVLRDGELSQPMSEAQVCEFVFQERLTDDVKIKQGESDFFPVSEVRALFAALRNQGWYVRSGGTTYGPFVGDKFLTLVRTQFFEADAIRVRQGPDGEWVRFETAKRSFERQSRNLKQKLGTEPTEQGKAVEQLTAAASQESQSGGDAENCDQRFSVARVRKRQPNKTRACVSCNREHQEKTLLCLACAAKKKKQHAELAKHKNRIQGADANHSENPIVKVIMLVVAFGASGFFLSKWLVTTVVWREFFVQGQQMIGWVYFVLGAVLLLVGAAVIWFDPYRNTDRKLIATAAVSLLLVGGSCVAVDYGRLAANQQQMQMQNEAWAELMLNGGYGEDEP
jgi:hypothetical protein